MRFFRFLLLPILAVTMLGMAKKPMITVRFHVEKAGDSGSTFVMPVKFHNPERDGFVEKIPSISERDVVALYPFPAPDGSLGCAFKLSVHGRISLEELSTVERGRSLVVFVSTKNGVHQVIDMLIDQPIRDGIITVQRGLTQLEIGALQQEYPTLGEGGKKKKKTKS